MNRPVLPYQPDRTSGTPSKMAPSMRLTMRVARKVPEVTIYFWIIKLLTTAMGESTSDYLVHQLNPFIAVALGGIGLAAALILQLAVRRYIVWIYWLAVIMVAIFGTMAADVIHIGFGIPYPVSTAFFTVALAIVFVAWYITEKTLSIHSIYTLRRELFYWATIITTFALGTAAGDLAATTPGLGYFSAGVLFAVLIAVPALSYKLFGLNEIFAFWFAYIVTRPLWSFICRLDRETTQFKRSWTGVGMGQCRFNNFDSRLRRLLDGHSQG